MRAVEVKANGTVAAASYPAKKEIPASSFFEKSVESPSFSFLIIKLFFLFVPVGAAEKRALKAFAAVFTPSHATCQSAHRKKKKKTKAPFPA